VNVDYTDNNTGQQATAAANATISGTNWTVTLPLKNANCGDTVTIYVICKDASGGEVCDQSELEVAIDCNCCPTIRANVTSIGPCDSNGNRPVTIAVTVVAKPPPCPSPSVILDFGDSVDPHTTGPHPGSFSGTDTYSPGTHTAHVRVLSPDNCLPIPISFTVKPCPPNCCPTFPDTIYVTEAGCTNGKRTECIKATVDVPAGCKDVTVEWDFGDQTSGSPHTYSSGSHTFTECHPYSPGTYQAQLNVTSPQNCPSSSPVIVTVRPCSDCCPKITNITAAFGVILPLVVVGDCDSNGNRNVGFYINVIAKPLPCPNTQVQIDFGDNTTGIIHSGSGEFVEIHTYSPGSYAAIVNVLSPPGCPPISIPFTVSSCCCPGVSVIPCIPDCGDDGNRDVTFKIDVNAKSSPPCPPTVFIFDFGDGTAPLAPPPLTGGSYSNTVRHTYVGTSDHNPTLNVVTPKGCTGWTTVIPGCCEPEKMKKCKNKLGWMTVFLGLALYFLLLGLLCACPPQPATSCILPLPQNALLYMALGSLVILFLPVLILFLGDSCPKCLCGWLLRLLWRVCFIVGAVYAALAKCCGLIWQFGPFTIPFTSISITIWLSIPFFIGVGLMVLGVWLLFSWARKCCVTWCDLADEFYHWGLLITIITVIALLIGALPNCKFELAAFSFFPYHLYGYYLIGLAVGLIYNYMKKRCTPKNELVYPP